MLMKFLILAILNIKIKSRTFFEQKMFYYKLNLVHPNFIWYGSKICKKKYLKSPQWLRNIKSKKYPRWRIDAFFRIPNIII